MGPTNNGFQLQKEQIIKTPAELQRHVDYLTALGNASNLVCSMHLMPNQHSIGIGVALCLITWGLFCLSSGLGLILFAGAGLTLKVTQTAGRLAQMHQALHQPIPA